MAGSILRRRTFGALAAATLAPAVNAQERPRIVDAHFPIIDPRFPLIANEGTVPSAFDLSAYRAAAEPRGIVGGAVVAGSAAGTPKFTPMPPSSRRMSGG